MATDAARIGGRILQEWRTKFTARLKSPKDLVTEADVASQQAIHRYVQERFPDHSFLGEEGLSRDTGSRYRWVIDPLDGTSNYVHGFPYYAVSIGVECDGELAAGVVYDPNRDELFSAAQGEGATCNGEPLSVSQAEDLSQALCMVSLPMLTTREHPAVQRFLRILETAQHVQRTGSAALNLVGVAAGRIDAFWSMSLKPWDMAAGVLIVREAGGRVTKSDGNRFDLNQPDLLATCGSDIHGSLATLLQ